MQFFPFPIAGYDFWHNLILTMYWINIACILMRASISTPVNIRIFTVHMLWSLTSSRRKKGRLDSKYRKCLSYKFLIRKAAFNFFAWMQMHPVWLFQDTRQCESHVQLQEWTARVKCDWLVIHHESAICSLHMVMKVTLMANQPI